MMTGLVLDNAYGGGLASTFTVPRYEPSIDTIQDIVDRKLIWGATHDAWIFSLILSQEVTAFIISICILNDFFNLQITWFYTISYCAYIELYF